MPLNISRIRALCFDVDGTLRDTDDQLVDQIASLLKPIGLIFPAFNPNDFSRRFIMGIENPANSLQTLADRLNVDLYLSRLFELLQRTGSSRSSIAHPVIPGVPEMLSVLSNRFLLGVVSARGERQTHDFLDKLELRRFFKVVVSGQTCRRTKPHPSPVIYAARQMGVTPAECLMVGDTTVDIRAGRLAGAQTVGVLCGFGYEQELVAEGADLILPTTPLLLNYLLT